MVRYRGEEGERKGKREVSRKTIVVRAFHLSVPNFLINNIIEQSVLMKIALSSQGKSSLRNVFSHLRMCSRFNLPRRELVIFIRPCFTAEMFSELRRGFDWTMSIG